MKLSLVELKPGMVLEQAIHTDDNKCLLNSGTALTLKNIEKLKALKIEEIYVKDVSTIFVSPADKMAESLIGDFITRLRKTAPRRREANKHDYMVEIEQHLEKIILKIAKIEEILEFLVELKLVDNVRLYQHSIYTAILSGLVAGCMKLDEEDILCSVAGGLLHHIGICEMPMLVGLESLTEAQQKLWDEHPTYGYYFAVQKNIPRKIANAIQCHHERWNGSGYPKGISGEEIPLVARIVSVCAHYSSCVTYKNVPPYMAIEDLYGASGMYYDPDVVNAFVNNIAIYPLGEMVRLSTKEVGIVSNIRKNEGPRPIVKVYYNRVNRPISEDKIIDLGVERTVFIEEIL